MNEGMADANVVMVFDLPAVRMERFTFIDPQISSDYNEQ